FELNLGGGNFKAQFRRADRSGAAYALIVGDDELARGVVAMKPLRLEAGQTECPMDGVVAGGGLGLKGETEKEGVLVWMISCPKKNSGNSSRRGSARTVSGSSPA